MTRYDELVREVDKFVEGINELMNKREESSKEGNRYEIWMSGYVITGDRAKAHFHGFSRGEDFRDACINEFKGDSSFNEEYLTYWGCTLHDNEEDARKSFG